MVRRGGVSPNVLGSLGGLSIGQQALPVNALKASSALATKKIVQYRGTRTEGRTEKRDCGDILIRLLGGLGARSRQRQAKNLPRGFSLVPADPALPPRQPASAKKPLGPLKRWGNSLERASRDKGHV